MRDRFLFSEITGRGYRYPNVPAFPGKGFRLERRYEPKESRQASPDKDVNFHCTAAPFTVSPEPRALTCCADLSGDWTLYAVSVRLPVLYTQTGRLIALRSGFLQTNSHEIALAFG